jgi:hypothetical protein
MKYQRELEQAKENARLYGWPGRAQNTPNSKTGTFTGYWRNGRVAWKGSFHNGNQVGLWEYQLIVSAESTQHEFYCNL